MYAPCNGYPLAQLEVAILKSRADNLNRFPELFGHLKGLLNGELKLNFAMRAKLSLPFLRIDPSKVSPSPSIGKDYWLIKCYIKCS